jgi:hypothetical protein
MIWNTIDITNKILTIEINDNEYIISMTRLSDYLY